MRQFIYFGFVHIAEHRKPAAHVPVKGSVTHRHFTFIAGIEQNVPKLVGKSHQQHAPNPCLQIFFRDVEWKAPKVWLEGFHVSLIHGLYSNQIVLYTQGFGQFSGIIHGVIGRVLRRHQEHPHIIGSKGARGQHYRDGGVNSPGKPQNGFFEPQFAKIIANTHQQGVVHQGYFSTRLLHLFLPSHHLVQLVYPDTFFKKGHLIVHITIGRHHYGASVKQQFGLPAYVIDVKNRHIVALYIGPDDVDAFRRVITGKRGSRYVDHQLRLVGHHFVHWTNGVKRIFIANVPNVFTNREGNAFAHVFDDLEFRCGLKIAVFIKYVVSRQQGFVLYKFHPAISQKVHRVVQIFPLNLWVPGWRTHHNGDTLSSFGQCMNTGVSLVDKVVKL